MRPNYNILHRCTHAKKTPFLAKNITCNLGVLPIVFAVAFKLTGVKTIVAESQLVQKLYFGSNSSRGEYVFYKFIQRISFF